MKDLVGLNNVKTFINNSSIDTFPHSLILLGKEGSGKTEICSYISEHLNIGMLDITEDLSEDLIYNIYRYPNMRIYVIDVRKIPEKKQNVFLKLFEEPSSNTFVIVLANSKFQLLPTVLNRGTILNMDNYSIDDLLLIAEQNHINIDSSYLQTILRTPGDILKLYSNNITIEDIENLCEKIVHQLSKASFPNTLTIVDKINFKDEYDKIDLNLFLNFLYMKYQKEFELSRNKLFLEGGKLVNDVIKKLSFDQRLNKRILISNLLTKLWKLNREN